MRSGPTPRARQSIVSLLVAIGLFAGVPWLLAGMSRVRFGSANPVTGVRAPWRWSASEAVDVFTDPLADDTVADVVVRLALVTAWLAVAVVAVTTFNEFVHMVRHRGVSSPPVRGTGWAQGTARLIAAGLLVVTPLFGQGPTASARAPLARSAMPTPVPTEHVTTVPPEMVKPATSRGGAGPDGTHHSADTQRLVDATPTLHIVQPGESVWSIAQRLAHESSLSTIDIANEILDANLGAEMPGGGTFTNPAYIEVGWELVIPTDARSAESGTSSSPPRDGRDYVVVDGDTLSSIAADALGDAGLWPEIWSKNAGTSMGDGQTFDDPNLIIPGWELDLPGIDTKSGTPTTGTPTSRPDIDLEPVEAQSDDAPTAPDVALDDKPPNPAPVVEAPATTPTPAPTLTPAPAPAPAPTSPATSTPATSSPYAAPQAPARTMPPPTAPVPSSTLVPVAADPAGTETSGPTRAPFPVRPEQAAMLAAGVLALVGLHRRQRLRRARPRARVPQPPPAVTATERRLRTADPGERAARVDVAVRAVAHELLDDDAQIVLVTLHPSGELVVHLTAPAHLSSPWVPVERSGHGEDGAIDWRLDASVPIELLSDGARRSGSPCHAFVQLGISDDADVLIDLEACGALAIEAPADAADEVVTALAAGLATSPYAEAAHLITVSASSAIVLGHRNAHQASNLDGALHLARELAGSTCTTERTSFSLRALRTGGEAWEPAVVLLNSADRRHVETMTDPLPVGGHGLAVVASVEPGAWHTAPTRLVASDDGWTFVGFRRSIPISPIGVDDADLAAIGALLDDAMAPLVSEAVEEEFVAGADSPAEENGPVSVRLPRRIDARRRPRVHEAVAHAASPPAPAFEPTHHRIMVRLLGGVEVSDTSGATARFERSKTLELIAWLATHREHSTRSAARTALWALDVRDATFANVVSEARRGLARLVVPPDDSEWLGRTLTEQLPLHEWVVTDAELIAERLAAARLMSPAEAIDTLRPAAAMLRGFPFAGTTYLWPDAEGLTSNYVLLATSVTTELAAHGLSVGDTELVFWATGRGLAVLPGHEELIGLRMRAHARAGDLAGVRQEWEAYERVLVADAWSDGEPAPELLALRRTLLG